MLELVAVPVCLIVAVWLICTMLDGRARRHRELLDALRDRR